MPDITMCSGKDCSKAKKCYRATATPKSFWQSYFTEPPIDKSGECEYFWEEKPKTKPS